MLKGVPRDQVAEMIRKEWAWEPKPSTPSTGDLGSLEEEDEFEDEGAKPLDEKIALGHGLHAGNYDAAYRGGDWESGLAEQEEAGNPAFDAAYIIGFISGSSDSWMDDPDYQSAWDEYGKKIQALGLVADSPYELSSDYDDDTGRSSLDDLEQGGGGNKPPVW